VLGCGDLPHYYLEFIVSMLNAPLYYVMGNHGFEVEYANGGVQRKRPEGCVDIDEHAVTWRGLSIAGLQGSMRYKDGPYQYTQAEMDNKSLLLSVKLLQQRLKNGRWLDILVTHAPPYGIHAGKDLCHTGFCAFLRFMDRFKPRYLIHGHSHLYSQLQTTTTQYGVTTVINAYPYRLLDIEPLDPPQKACPHEG
jgi:Icc-related predicted phosphoesterase